MKSVISFPSFSCSASASPASSLENVAAAHGLNGNRARLPSDADPSALDRVYTASLPVLSGGPMAALKGDKRARLVFSQCALILSRDRGRRRDSEDENELPVVISMDLERVGQKRLRISVSLDLRDAPLHASSVKLHGGAYFYNCGIATTSSTQDSDVRQSAVFELDLARPGTRKTLDESTCLKASHDQCNFNDSCMLELSVRVRDESVTVRSVAELGSRLASRLASMYRDGARGADMAIRCRGVEFPFYRMVLAAQSDVLEAMLEETGRDSGGGGAKFFLEGKAGVVEVEDFAPEVVAAFLKLLATGQLGKNEFRRHSLDLFSLCDKYNVTDLLPSCESEAAEAALSLSLACSLDEALRYLVRSHLHGSESIRRAALASIRKRRGFKTDTDGWSELRDAFPDLAKEAEAAIKL